MRTTIILLAVIGLAATSVVQAAKPIPVLPKMMDEKTAKAIDKGLEYLASTQRPDGMWYPTGGYGTYPSCMTALAGLAMIAGGSTPETGPYAKNVRRAMFYLLRVGEAEPTGILCGPDDNQSMHAHGFALLFLAQCYGNDLDPKTEARLHKVLDKAVALTAKSQSDNGPQFKHAGGWIYNPGGGGDEGSVTVTQLQALRACRNAGIEVPKSTIERAVEYLRVCQQKDGGICYQFSRGAGSGSQPAISAAAIACFYSAGVYDREAGGKGSEAEMVDRLLKYCKDKVVPEGGQVMGHYFYAHMYYAEALFQRGGVDWEAYYPKMRDHLVQIQGADGSWMGDGVGMTYGTAIGTLILQLPYGYLPVCQR